MDLDKLQRAFASIYDQHADAIFRYAYYKISDREQALDLTQQTFMKAWDYMRAGNQIQNINAFLYKIANNLIIDEYRKRKNASLDSLADDGFDPKDESMSASAVAELREAFDLIKKLNQNDQNLVIWRYVEEWPIEKIASALKESENVVSVRIHRAMKKLRGLLN